MALIEQFPVFTACIMLVCIHPVAGFPVDLDGDQPVNIPVSKDKRRNRPQVLTAAYGRKVRQFHRFVIVYPKTDVHPHFIKDDSFHCELLSLFRLNRTN